ncbi:MAG: FAD-dependent oxidoreductase [Steroidobacteraceae bacterium]
MKRRAFIQSAIGSAGAIALADSSMASAFAAEAPHYDFIIIGAGTAGLPAAIFASRRGAKVLLIDAATDIGGTLHLANGQVAAAGTRIQAAKGIVDTPDAHYEDVMRLSRGFADKHVIRRTADEAPATINWLLDAGLVPLADHPVTGDSPGRKAYNTPRYLWAKDEGRAILAVVRRELEPEVASGRVTVQLNTRATGLLVSDKGEVQGVRAIATETPSGAPREFIARGRHVLLTSGGYAMNPELFEQLCGVPAYAAGSYPYSQGQGLAIATSIGGWLRGQDLHRPGSGSILTSEQFPAKVYARFDMAPRRLPWEIWVNNQGQRFLAEDSPDSYQRERLLLKQEKLRYQIFFDHGILEKAPSALPKFSRDEFLAHFDKHPMFHRADTLEALAEKARIELEGLRSSIRDYNSSVKTGSDAFGRKHFPMSIGEKGPFYAVTHLGHSATSSAGVVVDQQLRVVRGNGEPIPNFYAAGEVLGSGATLGNAFAPGMMLTPALALGRWLGMTLPIS